MDQGFALGSDAAAAAKGFDDDEEESATVEGGDGEKVEEGKVQAEDGDESDKREDSGPGNLSGNLGDADGPGKALTAFGGGEDVAYGLADGGDEPVDLDEGLGDDAEAGAEAGDYLAAGHADTDAHRPLVGGRVGARDEPYDDGGVATGHEEGNLPAEVILCIVCHVPEGLDFRAAVGVSVLGLVQELQS